MCCQTGQWKVVTCIRKDKSKRHVDLYYNGKLAMNGNHQQDRLYKKNCILKHVRWSHLFLKCMGNYWVNIISLFRELHFRLQYITKVYGLCFCQVYSTCSWSCFGNIQSQHLQTAVYLIIDNSFYFCRNTFFPLGFLLLGDLETSTKVSCMHRLPW